jgi:hypothetical protein
LYEAEKMHLLFRTRMRSCLSFMSDSRGYYAASHIRPIKCTVVVLLAIEYHVLCDRVLMSILNVTELCAPTYHI